MQGNNAKRQAWGGNRTRRRDLSAGVGLPARFMVVHLFGGIKLQD